MKRTGFTLIEVFVGVVIIAIVAMLLLGVTGAFRSSKTETFNAECIRKYEYDRQGENGGTQFRVDVRRKDSEFIETLINEDDMFIGKRNSGTIHANILKGNWYRFDTRGERNERWSWYPNITTIQQVQEDVEPLVEEDGEINL